MIETTALPQLILVVGRPGAGKSTLARKLARSIHCPLVSRDDIKEGIVNTVGDKGEPEREITWTTYSTFFDNIELLLRNKVTLVAEAAFRAKRWAPKIDPLRELATIKAIRCHIGTDLANQRVRQRRLEDPEWNRFHNEPPIQPKEMLPTGYDPSSDGLDSLTVDTSEDYNPSYETILEFISSSQKRKSD